MGCDPECDGNNQYQCASPARLLPLNSHCLLISGQNDEVYFILMNFHCLVSFALFYHICSCNVSTVQDVPSDLVAQYYILCTTFAAKHKRNEDACTNVDNRDSFILEYHEIRNADHYMLVDAETSAWAELSQIYFKTFGKCQETPLSP